MYRIFSVYLSASPGPRGAQVEKLCQEQHVAQSITIPTLMGGDFNCVENVETDTAGTGLASTRYTRTKYDTTVHSPTHLILLIDTTYIDHGPRTHRHTPRHTIVTNHK